MPQFDTSTFISQLFWLTICLGMVVFCFSRIFIPRFNDMLEKRFSKIQHDLEAAQLFEAQTKGLAEKYEHELTCAKQKAEDQIKETVAELVEKKRKQLISLDEELSSSIKAMEKSFERKQTLMIEAMEPLAKEFTQHILQHILGQSNEQTPPADSAKIPSGTNSAGINQEATLPCK